MIPGKLLAANTGYRLLNVAVVFVINILLSRLAGVNGYGLIALLVANAGIFNLLSAFGADAGITFHAASHRLAAGKLLSFLWMIILFQLLAAVLAEVVFFAATGHFLLFKATEWKYGWLGILFLLGISLSEKYTALLYGQHQFTRCSLAILFSNLIMLGWFAFSWYSGKPELFEVYLTTFVVLSLLQAILLATTYHVISKNAFSFQAPGRNDWSQFFSYSLLTFIINLVQFLAYRIDYWLIDYYRGEQELGWYSLAVRLLQLFWVLPVFFAGIIFPVVAGQSQSYSKEKLHALIRGMNGLNLAAGIISFLLVPFLLPVFFGDEFTPSVALFRVLLPGILMFCIATMLAAFYAGQKKLRINLTGSLICLLVILVLDLVLIPARGMRGAAIASSIGYGVTAIYFIAVYCLNYKVSPAKLIIPRRGDWQYLKNMFRERN